MFVADRLLYLELQKTGGSHICRLLEQYIDGTIVEKHNKLGEMDNNRLIVGSIRNPWDWYVSLWAFGSGGRGALRYRTTKGVDFEYYHRMLPKDMGKNWLTPSEFIVSLYHDLVKPVSLWQNTYLDAANPERFQDWLKLLLDSKRRYDVGEGFGFSPLSQHCGLMTYRYFRLYTLGDVVFSDKGLNAPSYIDEFDQKYNITGIVIRNESLESDFIEAKKMAGYTLSDKDVASVLNKELGKTNTSERKSTAHYYDDETLSLVAEREKYIIEKYNYEAPQ